MKLPEIGERWQFFDYAIIEIKRVDSSGFSGKIVQRFKKDFSLGSTRIDRIEDFFGNLGCWTYLSGQDKTKGNSK